jgi:hypothetical protein
MKHQPAKINRKTKTLTVRSKAITSGCSLYQQTIVKKKKNCFSHLNKVCELQTELNITDVFFPLSLWGVIMTLF